MAPDEETLIDLIYEGVGESEPWRGLLDALRTRVEARSCAILLQPQALLLPAMAFRVGVAAEDLPRYWSRHYLVDPFVNLPPDTPVTLAAFAGELMARDDFDESFKQEIAQLRVLGLDVRLDSGADVRVRLTRPAHKPDFSEAELALCRSLAPHLKRALNLFVRLKAAESERNLYQDAFAHLLIGAAIVRADGAVLTLNPPANAIVQEGDGLKIIQGRLCCTDATAQKLLQAQIQAAAETNASGYAALPLRVERPSGHAPLALIVRPAPAGENLDETMRKRAIVLISDPTRQRDLARDVLGQLLGLTPAESNLAALIAQGVELSEAAAELGIRTTTARTHLRAIFQKTGVNRQSDLVRLVLAYMMLSPH